jgi:hypothetical protein
MLLQNVGWHTVDGMALYPRSQNLAFFFFFADLSLVYHLEGAVTVVRTAVFIPYSPSSYF